MHQRKMKKTMRWLRNMFSRASFALPAAHRLDGRSRALLAASFRPLRDDEPGWITMQEARKLFSSVDESHALGENDKLGNANLAAFASALEAQIEFSPSAGLLYLMRKAASGAGLHARDPRKVLAFVR
jgi:hypothetical protein